MNAQLKTYLNINYILSPHQSGFRPNHSTVSATTLVVNDIVNGLDNRKHCAAVFIDLSKAFDTVDHSLLLLTLSTVGFTPGAYAWFKSYLDGRHQSVKIGMSQSESILISKGVPQGSVFRVARCQQGFPAQNLLKNREIAQKNTIFFKYHLLTLLIHEKAA